MAIVSSSSPQGLLSPHSNSRIRSYPSASRNLNKPIFVFPFTRKRENHRNFRSISSQICTHETPTLTLEKPSFSINEAESEDELWAAACLRVRSFNAFDQQTFNIEDHKRYLAECEFEALKDRIAGKRIGFKRVSCINATLPVSQTLHSSDDLCSTCKFSKNGEARVVVGTLDLNQCLRLPDEIVGKKPEGSEADLPRAYLSNVCVAKELHRNGVGYAIVAESKKVAKKWGITDLYVHVADDNEAAKKLYIKSGFIYEDDEPTWQARFLGRPRRILLWSDLTKTDKLEFDGVIT